MTGSDLVKRLVSLHGCEKLRQRGSHVRVRCRECHTTIPVHGGEDLGPGLLAQIRRDLDPCLGRGWMER